MAQSLEHRTRLLRWTAVGSVAVAVVTAGWTIANSAQQRREDAEELGTQYRVRLDDAESHVAQYLSDVALCLQVIGLHSDVLAMSAQTRDEVETLYKAHYAQSRLAGIYVVERDFDGSHPPRYTFEPNGGPAAGVLHTPEREQAEYSAQIQQLRQFEADPRCEVLISAEVPLCVGERGVVLSVPIRHGPELAGLVAGMVPQRQLTALLDKSSEHRPLLLASDRGHLFASSSVPADARAALAAEIGRAGAPATFDQQPRGTRFGAATLVSRPARLPDGGWYLALLYDEDAELRMHDASGLLAGDVRAGMVLLLGAIVAVLCRVSGAALAARQQAAARAAELSVSEERFRAIVEATPVPIAITREADDAILRANVPLEQLLGATEAELLTRRTADFCVDLDARQRLQLRGRGCRFALAHRAP